MTAPVLSTILATQTHLDVQFDQALVAPTGAPGAGFSATRNGAALAITGASIVSSNTVRLTVALIQEGDTISVAFTNTGTLTNSGAENATNFSGATPSSNTSPQPALLASAIAVHGSARVLSLIFTEPVSASGGPGTAGFTVLVNSVPVTPSSSGIGGDQREFQLTLPADLNFSDVVHVSYDSGTGHLVATSTTTPLVSFTADPVNGSMVGVPNTAYPLSNVIRNQLAPKNGTVQATISCDINLVDQNLIDEYGPAIVDFGGTFGETMQLPAGVFIVQDLRPIYNGVSVTKNFLVVGNPSAAAVAAADWLTQMTARIATALGALRATDQTVDLGTRTIAQV